jgi:hypothetical protein
MPDEQEFKLALRQAAMELDEAAKIIAGFGLPSTSDLFKEAAARARRVAGGQD